MLIQLAVLGAIAFIFILTTIFATARFVTILQPLRGPPQPRKRGQRTHLLVVLGSGGHSAEMFAMLKSLDTHSYTHRSYITSLGDPISTVSVVKFEQELKEHQAAAFSTRNGKGISSHAKEEAIAKAYGSFSTHSVPRARNIHQSLLTTPFSCLQTLKAVLRHLRHPDLGSSKKVPKAPDLILTNGPATSAIVILASIILRFLDIGGQGHGRTRIVFVESMARIKSLSLSAKCVAPFVDRLIVQWETLDGSARGKAEYGGPIVVSSLTND